SCTTPQCPRGGMYRVTTSRMPPPAKCLGPRIVAFLLLSALLTLATAWQGARSAAAAPGDLVADLIVAEYPNATSPSVAFDGHFLYHVDYGGSVLHRVDVPPAGGPYTASGHVDL